MGHLEKTEFIELYSRAQKKIFLYILSMVHHNSDAEDILQQTASDMWRLYDRFEEGTNFVAWAIAIARYRVMSFRKKQNKDRLILSQAVYDQVLEELQYVSNNSGKRNNALRGCLKKLIESERKMLSMHYEDNLSYRKISEKLNLSKTGIYKKMAKIHTNLQICIKRTILIWETNG